MKGWWKGRRMRAGLAGAAGLGLLVCGLLSEHPAVAGLCAGLGIAVLGLAVSRLSQLFALRGAPEDRLRIEWADERNIAIREKAAWMAGNLLIPAMGLSALVLALTDHVVGACVLAGLLLFYSVCILFFSARYAKKL